ncbi:benzoate 4-monooxygenase cytochrome P450, partial [Penicillium lividum]
WLNPNTTGLFEMKRNVERLSIDALQGECATSAGSSARTIFQALSDQSVLPEERTVPRLRDEGMLLLGAGFETTARVVTIGAFYLYKNDYVLQSLRKELKQVMPTPTHKVSWTQLEKLPYLTAVVNESLRLAHSTIIRSPRVAPNRTLQYENYTIPPGKEADQSLKTPVSQSIYFVHADPSVFPNPHEFDPERWMQPSQSAERLSRFLVPFSMGSRMCIGMSLSYCEIYLMLAALVRRFNLKHETTHEDIRITRDLIIRFPDTETLQVRSYPTDILSN